MAQFNWPGFDELSGRLKALSAPTADQVRPLMERWEKVIFDDNRRGVLAGRDKDDREMVPVKQRTGKYKGLTGPPLAPSRDGSRSIANLVTDHFQDSQNRWIAIGVWEDVLSDRGVPFLPFHFRGEGYLPIRDLTGVRQLGLAEAEQALAEWARNILGR